MSVPLHPMLQAVVDAAADAPPYSSMTPGEVRAAFRARVAAIPRPPLDHIADRAIPGPRGSVPIRIYRPDLADGRPVIVYFHGGGFVIGDLESHDPLCRALCLSANAVVVAVDYALAPEHPFPAGIDDALAALRWVGEHATGFGGDPARLVVAGDSAGGTIAAATTLRARDEGAPRIAAQLLLYPVTDHPDPAPPSYTERGAHHGLTADTMRWFWAHYLARPEDAAHPHASPLRAASLADLPPAWILTAEYDPLRDEGDAYAARLAAAGVETTLICYPDMNHGFISLVGLLDRADEARAAACAWLATKV